MEERNGGIKKVTCDKREENRLIEYDGSRESIANSEGKEQLIFDK